jgi:L-ascorbate metabolism protein UlaG (beta-lactamase superfamily)
MRYLCSVFCALLAAGLLACSAPGTARQTGGAGPTPQTGGGGEITRLDLPAGLAATATGGSAQFIGTATVLLRYGALTILTDPNFLHKGDHVHLGYGLHSQRLTDPAIEFDHLPPIDLVILSHMHEDHFDKLVQQKLKRDLALLHLGGTRILGVVKVTMDGKDGVRMLQLVAPHHAIPIHYDDYDVFKSPLSDFQREVASAGLSGKVTYLNRGDTYQFVPALP